MADVKVYTSTPDPGAGGPIDLTQVTTGAGVVDRQRISIADSQTATDAPVSTAAPAGAEAGLYVRVVSQPAGGATVDVTDRVGRLVGHVNVDNFPVTQPVSGSVSVSNFPATQPVSAVSLPLPTGAATLAAQTQPGVDIGDVTINNAAGASAVNIQDGGNSITVDGTVTTSPPANASTNVAQVGGTATDTNSGNKSAGTLRVVLATDQPQLTNKLLVTPDSVALPANQSVNVAQLAGTTTDTNSGVKSAGTLRVVLATDQPALTNKLLVTPDSVALPANQSVNINQVGGAAITEGQKTMAASVPVVLASDQTTLPANSEARAATLHVTGTAAVNTALTITLPAAGAGLFHYITSINWVKLYSVIGVAAGAGVLITSTNLPGNPVWTTEQLASPAGTVATVIDYKASTPLKSSVANTATTIVAPLQLQTIWRGNVSYFTAA